MQQCYAEIGGCGRLGSSKWLFGLHQLQILQPMAFDGLAERGHGCFARDFKLRIALFEKRELPENLCRKQHALLVEKAEAVAHKLAFFGKGEGLTFRWRNLTHGPASRANVRNAGRFERRTHVSARTEAKGATAPRLRKSSPQGCATLFDG